MIQAKLDKKSRLNTHIGLLWQFKANNCCTIIKQSFKLTLLNFGQHQR